MRRCGLLGQTLKHSYSPAIHKALGGDYSYELFEAEPENVAEFLEHGDWDGINVTMPYKQTVIPYCKELSPAAAAIGSVNTILRRPDGSLCGDNTDAAGFRTMLHQSGIAVKGKKVLVLGSGGSSLTVRHVLREEGAGESTVISRKGSETYETLGRHRDAQVIINTTPVGMYPNTAESLIKLAEFPHLEGVLDLIYNPARTRLLMEAEALGISHLGGLPMLVGQAAAAAKHFAGDAPLRVPEHTVTNLLRHQMENIILIGMPGAGKTRLGGLLAERLGRPGIDIDKEIEKATGCTIPEIFAREGEEGFRRIETQILAQWGKESGLVIATGGGAVTREENYAHLHQNGRIILLERDLAKLERNGRPLSQGDLQALYERRFPLYQRFADCALRNEGEPEDVINQILEVSHEILSH